MAEYWKSTPTYWCKFCSTYIKDTPLEKKSHEATGKHQNHIQRSLRELHKKKDREERDASRAKAEVERLNGLVAGKPKNGGGGILGARDLGGAAGGAGGGRGIGVGMSKQQQRKAHAEQLAALGVALPEELKREVTGVGGWETVSERVVEDEGTHKERGMADIVKREREIEGARSRGAVKREREDNGDEDGDEAGGKVMKREAWGSRVKVYPGSSRGRDSEGQEDLDALLNGVTAKRPQVEQAQLKDEEAETNDSHEEAVKNEGTKVKPSSSSSGTNDVASSLSLKQEDSTAIIDAPPVVFFKKRKAKK